MWRALALCRSRFAFETERTDVIQINDVEVLAIRDHGSRFRLVEYETFRMPDYNPRAVIHMQFKWCERLLLESVFEVHGFHVLG